MDKTKEFFKNISQTGWIIIVMVIVLILLVIVGVSLNKQEVKLVSSDEYANDTDFIDSEVGEKLLEQIDGSFASAKDSVLSTENVSSGEYSNSIEDATLYVQKTKEVQVAVVIDEGEYIVEGLQEKECGKFAFVTTRVPNKPGVINETLKAMFADKVDTDFEPGNIIPEYHPNLVFDKAVLEEGVAKIYLRGDFAEIEENKCAKDLAINQIEETVKQFDTVVGVEIYQNLQKVN